MSDLEKTLRLLEELERLDFQSSEDPTPLPVRPSALLKALVESDFELNAAVLGVHDDS